MAKQNAILWGATTRMETTIEYLEPRFNLMFIVDNSQIKQGTTYFGMDVRSPDTILKYPDYAVIIDIEHPEEAFSQMSAMGGEQRIKHMYIGFMGTNRFYMKHMETKWLPPSICMIIYTE